MQNLLYTYVKFTIVCKYYLEYNLMLEDSPLLFSTWKEKYIYICTLKVYKYMYEYRSTIYQFCTFSSTQPRNLEILKRNKYKWRKLDFKQVKTPIFFYSCKWFQQSVLINFIEYLRLVLCFYIVQDTKFISPYIRTRRNQSRRQSKCIHIFK